MTQFRLLLVLLCLGILGALPFILSLPRPAAAVETQQASAMRTEFLQSMRYAVSLADRRQFDEAQKLLDELSAVPDKSNLETQMVDQLRVFIGGRRGNL